MDDYEKMEDLKDALDLARNRGDPEAEAAALYGIGRLYRQDRDFEAAGEFWSRCEAVCRESGRDKELAQVLVDLGDLAQAAEDRQKAGERYQEALGLFRTLGLPQGEARLYDRLGGLALLADQTDQALGHFQEGLALCRWHDDRIGALFFLEQVLPLLKAQGLAAEVDRSYQELVT
ncbi:MAG: tetratricopeptide repeat protein, partial [Thermodesulfobacteriota bacterium]